MTSTETLIEEAVDKNENIRGLISAMKKADDLALASKIDENTKTYVREYLLPELEEIGLQIVSTDELSTIASKSAEKNLTQEEKDMLSCLCEDERNRLIFQQPVPKKYYRLLMGIEKKLDRPKEQQ